jgi:hypothetical protein
MEPIKRVKYFMFHSKINPTAHYYLKFWTNSEKLYLISLASQNICIISKVSDSKNYLSEKQ